MATRDERVAYHEAGHNVVRVLLRGRPHCVTIDPAVRSSEATPPRVRRPADLSHLEIEDEVTALYAGYVGHIRFAPREEPQAIEGALVDEDQAEQLLALHTRGRSAELRARLRQRASDLVATHWNAVEELAREFLAERRLEPARVVAIVQGVHAAHGSPPNKGS